jgi:hypothetical protein
MVEDAKEGLEPVFDEDHAKKREGEREGGMDGGRGLRADEEAVVESENEVRG